LAGSDTAPIWTIKSSLWVTTDMMGSSVLAGATTAIGETLL
jgi:hypothetical protein